MDELTILSALQALGFGAMDGLLIVFAPLCAGIGSTVHGMLVEMNPTQLPRGGRVRTPTEVAVFMKWCPYRLFIGCALGLVVALYFVGSLSHSPTSLARVLALAVFVGYAAPKLWSLQEDHLVRQIESRLGAESVKTNTPGGSNVVKDET